MKTLLSFLLTFVVLGVYTAGAQICVPDTTVTGTGITPDTLLPMTEGVLYDETATVVIPTDTIIDTLLPPATIDFFQLVGTGGLPAWVSVACEPATCTFVGGSSNCVRISGTPPQGSAGTYPLEFYILLQVTVQTPFGPQTLQFPDTISGYFLDVLPPTGNCVPDFTVTSTGISPDTLPKLFEGSFYDVTATVVIPTDTIIDTTLPPATIDFFQLVGTGGIPSWVNVACEPPTCTFAGGTTNCVQVSGQVPCGAAGMYPLEFYILLQVTVQTPFGPQTLQFPDTISGFFLQVCPMAAPENVTSVEGCSNVTMSWDPVPGAVGYQLSGGPVGLIGAAVLDLAGTSITVNNLVPACYEWYVRAKCDASNFGSWSERDTFCLPLACGSPAPISSTVSGPTGQNVTLNWTAVPGALGYQIQGGPGTSSTAVSLDVIGGASTSLTVNNLTCGTYSWRIRAVCCVSPFSASAFTSFDIFGICPAGKTGTAEEFLSADMTLEMYPNPASNQVKLVIANGDVNESLNISIYDMSGKEVYLSNYNVNSTFDEVSINTSDFAKGIYQVVSTNGETTINQRLMIAR